MHASVPAPTAPAARAMQPDVANPARRAAAIMYFLISIPPIESARLTLHAICELLTVLRKCLGDGTTEALSGSTFLIGEWSQGRVLLFRVPDWKSGVYVVM